MSRTDDGVTTMGSYFRAIAVAAALILCVIVPARADEVDDYVERQLRRLHIPGLSLAVVRNGRVIKAQGLWPREY